MGGIIKAHMWKMIDYAVDGRGHRKENIPCQDKTESYSNENVYVIALADGAGSCKYSHYGAELTVKYAIRLISKNFDLLVKCEDGEKIKKVLLRRINKILDEEAKKLECRKRELSSTLLLVGIKEDKFFMLHIGDGIIGIVRKGKLETASKPFNGEYSNSTSFVTSNNAENVMKIYRGSTKDIDAFVLLSDGAGESLYYKKEEKLSNGVQKIINTLAFFEEEKVLENVKKAFDKLIINQTFDDCSIAVAVKRSYSEKVYSKLNENQKIDLLGVSSKEGRYNYKELIVVEKIVKRISDNPINKEELLKNISIKRKKGRKVIYRLKKKGIIKEKKGNIYSKLNL